MPSSLLLDALYCDEEGEVIQELDQEQEQSFSVLLLEQDLFWEDEELVSLFTKEKKQFVVNSQILNTDSVLFLARQQGVEWILKVKTFYGFTTLTSILAINYLDRFLCSLHFQTDCYDNKPWMIQLLAVTCLSLAAKIEETQVPLLLDLQVEETKYVFEAKTIQRMELLVLSCLQWRMHLVTPLSFIDHIVRRLGLKTNLHWQFLNRCELLLLTLLSDSKFVSYLPSVLATTTMMHVVEQLDPLNAIDYHNQLLDLPKISKEEVNECYEKIEEVNGCYKNIEEAIGYSKKRKYEASSPSGVIEAAAAANETWETAHEVVGPISSFKKSRGLQQTSLYASFWISFSPPNPKYDYLRLGRKIN